jgi:hypothetical protein
VPMSKDRRSGPDCGVVVPECGWRLRIAASPFCRRRACDAGLHADNLG